MKKLFIGLLFLVGCSPTSFTDMKECDFGCEVFSEQDTTEEVFETL